MFACGVGSPFALQAGITVFVKTFLCAWRIISVRYAVTQSLQVLRVYTHMYIHIYTPSHSHAKLLSQAECSLIGSSLALCMLARAPGFERRFARFVPSVGVPPLRSHKKFISITCVHTYVCTHIHAFTYTREAVVSSRVFTHWLVAGSVRG